jgi:hypothetical protein
MQFLLRKIATRVLPVVLAAMLLFASQSECVVKSASAMGQGGCCKHGPCKQSPGIPPHSTCQTAPARAESAIAPASDAQAAAVNVDSAVDEVVLPASEEIHCETQSTPPDLFVLNSSFLI